MAPFGQLAGLHQTFVKSLGGGCQINKITFQIWDLKIWQKDGLCIYYIEYEHPLCLKIGYTPQWQFEKR